MRLAKIGILPGAEPVTIEGNDYGVLMLHGFTSSPYEMKYLIDFLKGKGISISAPLLAGHGTSPEELAKCKWSDWYLDAKKALFDLRKKCKKIVAVGLSTGATLALHLAAHYQLEGVVAMSPALFLKEKKTVLLPLVPPFIKYRKKKRGPDISDDVERQKAVSYHKTPIAAAREVLKLYEHVKMDLMDIYTPLLIVQSKQDHVVDFKSAEYIYEHVSSQEKHFLKLEHSYHVVTLDVEKDIVFREIEQFTNLIFSG